MIINVSVYRYSILVTLKQFHALEKFHVLDSGRVNLHWTLHIVSTMFYGILYFSSHALTAKETILLCNMPYALSDNDMVVIRC